MLKLIASAITGVTLAGGVAYSYVQKEQQHIAQLTVENTKLHADNMRQGNAIDAAIKVLQEGKRGQGAP
jgi:hypothetical protein